MLYVMIQMTNWYYLEVDEIDEDVAENIQQNVQSGSLVMIADDLEYACNELGIEVDDLQKIES